MGKTNIEKFLKTVQAGNHAKVLLQLERRGDLARTADKAGKPCLCHARDAAMVEVLVKAGANPNARDGYGSTPLHETARDGNMAATRVLLDLGADVNAADNSGSTPLHLAAWHGHEEIIDLMLEAGASPLARDHSGAMPFHEAQVPSLAAKLKHFFDDSTRDLKRGNELEPDFSIGLFDIHDGVFFAEVKGGRIMRGDTRDKSRLWIQTDYPSLRAVRLSPDGRELLVIGPTKYLEFFDARDLKLLRRVKVPTKLGVLAAAVYSPDGRYILVADEHEEVHLLDAARGDVLATVEGGEWTGGLCFAPDGNRFATANSFQGGASVELYRIAEGVRCKKIASGDLADTSTPGAQFVDSLPHIEFIDDELVAVYQTSRIDHDAKPGGWRGDLVVLNAKNLDTRYSFSLDAELHGDERSLSEAGFPGGYYTRFAVDRGRAIIGMPNGAILHLDAHSGEIHRTDAPYGHKRVIEPVRDSITGRVYGAPPTGRPVEIDPA